MEIDLEDAKEDESSMWLSMLDASWIPATNQPTYNRLPPFVQYTANFTDSEPGLDSTGSSGTRDDQTTNDAGNDSSHKI